MSYCTSCRSELGTHDRFCSKCGTPKAAPSGEPPATTAPTGGGGSKRRLWPWAVGVVVLAFAAAAVLASRTSGSAPSTYNAPPASSSSNDQRLYISCDGAKDQAIQAMESQGTSSLLVVDIVDVRELRSNLNRASDGVALLCEGKAIVSGGSNRPIRFGVRLESGEAYVFMND